MNHPPSIAVIDHGAGNLVSISQALRRVGAMPSVIDSPRDLAQADAVVLPGVGSTAAVMAGIRSAGFESPLLEWRRPMLGICVGMQVLFEGSDEDGADCLGLLPGVVRPLRAAPRLPHIGWNTADPVVADRLHGGDPTYYFVHSYAPVPEPDGVTIGRTSYGQEFCSMVRAGHLAGTQFHPERSGKAGLALLQRFVEGVADAA